jgi:hypothetical protein
MSGIGHNQVGPFVRVLALRLFRKIRGERTMLQIPRPTPTCTRFQTTIEMPCIKCGALMRLALIEPHGPNFELMTYRCTPCAGEESFLQAI